jgi:L-threonylcarbamoyladenylate synthase
MRGRIRDAVDALARGGLVAYPTEGVWGLGCDPWNARASARLLAAKQRPVEKGLILIGARLEDFYPYVLLPSRSAERRALESWPGPTTWLFPAAPEAPPWVTGDHESVAIRIPGHPVARALCEAWGGALISTSANRAGEPPADSATAVRRRFHSVLDALVPGALGGLGKPSTIRDVRSGMIVRR